jgi:prephenate dehydrogenase
MPCAVTKPLDTVAIVGVGLIGGSIGLALRERGLARNVVGIGRRETSLALARDRGAATATTLDLAGGVASADVIVVCTSVADIARHVLDAAAACPLGALITDAGSTKTGIVAAIDGRLGRGVRFVGSHPLAGSEKTGVAHARADLFVDRLVVVTPGTTTVEEDIEKTSEFWTSLGAKVQRMSPEAHDEAAAAISHLPHAVACVLAKTTESAHLPLAATGWRDMTRIAGGEPGLWTSILLANRGNVLKGMAEFEKTWAALRQAMERGDATAVSTLLEEAKHKRDAVGS